MNPNYYVHLCIIGCHGNQYCIWFEQKVSYEGLLRGEMKSFKTFNITIRDVASTF